MSTSAVAAVALFTVAVSPSPLPSCTGSAVSLPVAVKLGAGVAVGLGVGVGLAVGLGVGDGVGLGDAVGLAIAVGLAVAVAVDEPPPVPPAPTRMRSRLATAQVSWAVSMRARVFWPACNSASGTGRARVCQV